MQRRNVSSGSEYESTVGYSRAVRTGPYVAVAGTTGAGDDIASQARDALHRIEIALAGSRRIAWPTWCAPACIVTDISLWRDVGEVHAEVFGDIRPVATMVEVSALIAPEPAGRDRGRRVHRRPSSAAYGATARAARTVPSASGWYGVTLITAVAGSGPYRCGNTIASGSVGTPGSQRTGEDNRAGSMRSSTQIGAAGVEPVRRQMHLLRRGQMHETVRGQRVGPKLAARLRRPPLFGTANVDQHGRQGLHTASLPGRQLGVTVRHDTPVNHQGTRPKPKASETVDIREQPMEVP